MDIPIPVVWSEDSVSHVPGGEVWLGVLDPGTEVPERALVLRAALRAAGAPEVPAVPHDDTILHRVHDAGLIEHLAGIWDEWHYPGHERVVPYVFPTPGMLAGLPLRSPSAPHGRAGRYCYDTMTLIGPGSWPAIRGAVDAALTAAALVSEGAPVAYALCRPPGHHATRDAYGGSSYLNNAAIAATALRAAGAARVAVVDIDAHHGNGTQAIFYDRPDVYYGSIHVDPAAGWFPHYMGHADERGTRQGQGRNRNVPLAPGTGDDRWLAALDVLCEDVAAFGADALVVSLGLDAAKADPESPLRVTADGYQEAGRRLRGLGPAVLIQEGGYDLSAIGDLVVASLAGFAGR